MQQPKERTFVLIKHDGIQRSLIGEITRRFERASLKLVGMKMAVPTRQQAEEHYSKDDAWCEKVGQRMIDNPDQQTGDKSAVELGREVLEQLYTYFISGPVVMMAWEGNQAVAVVKKLVGGTEPTTSDVGTIRSDYTLDSYDLANGEGRSVRNLIHCSEVVEDAKRELGLWFAKEELIEYVHINEKMLHDVNLDGIFE